MANVLSPQDSNYLSIVNAQPILTEKEEYERWVRVRDEKDVDAARQLVLSHLRYVVSVARKYMGYGIPSEDLIQQGNIGLMKAVKKFDPEKKVRLVSYAVHWIKAEIYDFILKNWKMVRIATTKVQKKLFFNLRQHRSDLNGLNEEEIQTLAKEYQTTTAIVREMESRMDGGTISFDPLVDDDDDGAILSPSAYLGDKTNDPQMMFEEKSEESMQKQMIQKALGVLDERSRVIISRRFLDENKPTLQELGNHFGVSAERIRQIEVKALSTMQEVMVGENYTLH